MSLYCLVLLASTVQRKRNPVWRYNRLAMASSAAASFIWSLLIDVVLKPIALSPASRFSSLIRDSFESWGWPLYSRISLLDGNTRSPIAYGIPDTAIASSSKSMRQFDMPPLQAKPPRSIGRQNMPNIMISMGERAFPKT